MDKIKIVKAVMDLMEERMQGHSFKKSFSRQCFSLKKDKDYTLGYTLVVYDRFNLKNNRNGIKIEPYLRVSDEPVEKDYLRITTREGLKLADQRTIGNRVADILANPSGKYVRFNESLELFVYEEADLKKMADRLYRIFEETVTGYFDKFANRSAIDKILNDAEPAVSVHCPIEPERRLRGLILAKLLGRTDITTLTEHHKKIIAETGNENYQVEFSRLLNIYDSL